MTEITINSEVVKIAIEIMRDRKLSIKTGFPVCWQEHAHVVAGEYLKIAKAVGVEVPE
jgi:hypothetical protein